MSSSTLKNSSESVNESKAAPQWSPNPKPIQYKRERGLAGLVLQQKGKGATETVHQVASEGITGSSSSLPHMNAIQKSFGKHDVSGIQAYVGGSAKTANERMGAEAYATGNSIAFRRSPDLHTSAHEAAHIIQQRSGVDVPGGVGQVGDKYERHADAVADLVVQGKSAESLLDTRGNSTTAVQKKPSSAKSKATGEPELESLQFQKNGGDAVQLAGDPPASGGSRLSTERGTQTEISGSLDIPIPQVPGLTFNVTLTGKYTTGKDGGQDFIEAEGAIRLSLNLKWLFLTIGVFAEGSVKFKAKNCTEFGKGFKKAMQEVANWFIAREFAQLPQKQQQIVGYYDTFKGVIATQIAALRSYNQDDRKTNLQTNDTWYLLGKTSLRHIIIAKEALVSDIRSIFKDLKGEVNPQAVYPHSTWIKQTIDEIGSYSDQGLNKIKTTLLGEADKRKADVNTQMLNLPAAANDPNVEFEANVKVGFKAGVKATNDTAVDIELSKGWKISDGSGAAFDTDVTDVYTAAVSVESKVNIKGKERKIAGQLAYEGEGPLSSPKSFKITGKVMITGMAGEKEDPAKYQPTIQSTISAITSLSGSGEGLLTAVKDGIVNEMKKSTDASWSVAGSVAGGIEVELKASKGKSLDSGHVKFLISKEIGGSIGNLALKGSQTRYFAVKLSPPS